MTFHLMNIGSEEKPDNFKSLIPIHPYAAYLLASISKQFSSSQRTLFKFLKEDDQQSFLQFIREYPNNDWYYYTADSLWDYFFLDDNSEIIERVRDVVSYCRSRVDNIKQEEHQRVFKAIMLLIALWRQMTEELVKPTKAKLELIFTGTPVLENLEVIIQELSEKGYIRSIPSGFTEEYMVPLMTIDERKINEKKREIESVHPFDKIINSNQEIGKKLLQLFELKGSARQRHSIVIVSAKDFKNKRERVAPAIKPYQIGIVLIVAREEEDIMVAEKTAEKINAATERIAYIVVQSAFGSKRWGNLLNHKAHYRYCQEIRDVENAKFYQKRVNSIIDEWLNNIQYGRKKVFIDGQEKEITDKDGYESLFVQLVNKIYPYGPEQIIGKATLYTSSYGKASAEIGLGIRNKIIQPYTDLVDELKKLEFWDDSKCFAKKPSHPISKMKQSIDEFFINAENINLYELKKAIITIKISNRDRKQVNLTQHPTFSFNGFKKGHRYPVDCG